MLDLVVEGCCGSRALLRHLRPSTAPDAALVDLRHLTFCEPLGLVAIAALADRAAAQAPVLVRGPEDPSVARYLSRMRLGAVLADLGIPHDLPPVQEHPLDDVLLELTRFEGSGGVDELARMVHRAAEDVDPEAAGALHDGVVEVGDNVPRHSRRSHGFAAAQKLRSGRDLLFAVADSGVGVLGTLRAAGATSSAHALALAVTEGVTEDPEHSGGTGLPEVVRHVGALDGHLHLVSGDAALTVGPAVRRRHEGGPAFPGTAIQGLVRRR